MKPIWPEPVVSIPTHIEFKDPGYMSDKRIRSHTLHLEANFNYAQWKTRRITGNE